MTVGGDDEISGVLPKLSLVWKYQEFQNAR